MLDLEQIRAALQSIIDQICAEEETPVIIREESSPRIKSKARTDSATSESERSNRSPLLITFPENMPEHSVQEAVRKVIFDNSTPEGNTRKAFLDKFKAEYSISNSKQLMLEVRHFIDGMHEHIIFSRAYSLAMLYQQQRQKLMVRKSKSGLPGLPSALEAIVSQREQQKFQRRKSLKVLMENNLGPTDLDEELLTTISYIVFVVVEEATFLSLKEHLIALVRQDKGYVSC